MRNFVYLLFMVILSYTSCNDEYSLTETDVDLIDDWEETIAIYSNINVEDSVHFVRVCRGYTSNDFFVGHTNPDSIYFDPSDLDVILYKIRVNNIYDGMIEDADTIGTYYCRDTLIHKDSTGYFTTEKLPVFYVISNDFKGTEVDDLYLGVEVVTPNSRVTSYTKIVGTREFKRPDTSNPYVFADFSEAGYLVMPEFPFYSQIFLCEATCSYVEVKGDGEIVPKSFTFYVGSSKLDFPVSHFGPYGAFVARSDLFYRGLERDILKNGDTINTLKRGLNRIYFTCYAGNADLALALESNVLSTGFTTDMINYSNVLNGVGLFTSYRQIDTDKIGFTENTYDTLISKYGDKYRFVRLD
jgi:hypothetical protein